MNQKPFIIQSVVSFENFDESQCVTIYHKRFSIDEFLDIKQWLSDNIGPEMYYHDKSKSNNNDWAIQSSIGSTRCFIRNDEKRTEFSLIWR